MRKENEKVNVITEDADTPHIPATLIGWVHNTTDNVVRVTKSRGMARAEKFRATEEEIVKALKDIKQKQA